MPFQDPESAFDAGKIVRLSAVSEGPPRVQQAYKNATFLEILEVIYILRIRKLLIPRVTHEFDYNFRARDRLPGGPLCSACGV
jgi:hypothetical protein